MAAGSTREPETVLFPACRAGRHFECIGYEPPSNLSWIEGADACECSCHDAADSAETEAS